MNKIYQGQITKDYNYFIKNRHKYNYDKLLDIYYADNLTTPIPVIHCKFGGMRKMYGNIDELLKGLDDDSNKIGKCFYDNFVKYWDNEKSAFESESDIIKFVDTYQLPIIFIDNNSSELMKRNAKYNKDTLKTNTYGHDFEYIIKMLSQNSDLTDLKIVSNVFKNKHGKIIGFTLDELKWYFKDALIANKNKDIEKTKIINNDYDELDLNI